MRGTRIVVGLALVAWLAGAEGAQAQLFGNRTVGQGITSPRARTSGTNQRSLLGQLLDRHSSKNNESALSGIGLPDTSARYMRGNREATDFVGTDSEDAGGFVGRQKGEAPAEIRSAIDDNLQVQSAPDANRTAGASGRRRTRMYQPRLSVDFDFARRPPAALNTRLTHRLESSLGLAETARVEVSVEGGTATLRGEVASERDRKLARLMLLFEPGISSVENELIVARRPATPSPSDSNRPTARPQGRP